MLQISQTEGGRGGGLMEREGRVCYKIRFPKWGLIREGGLKERGWGACTYNIIILFTREYYYFLLLKDFSIMINLCRVLPPI